MTCDFEIKGGPPNLFTFFERDLVAETTGCFLLLFLEFPFFEREFPFSKRGMEVMGTDGEAGGGDNAVILKMIS